MGVKGSDFLLEKGADPYTTIGGFRSKSIALNAEMVDVTSDDNVNKFRELLAGAGIKSLAFTGSGVINNSAAQKALWTDCLAQTVDPYRVTVPGVGTFAGNFQIINVEASGDHNAEGQVSVTVESAGDITFEAEA
ncbi:MAG: phage tail tube protein [Pseudomonadota bacterium]